MKKPMLFLSLISLLFCVSCQKGQPLIMEYLEQRHQVHLASSTRCVLILSERGCANCNLVFNDFVQAYVDDPRVQILLMGKGERLDLSSFQAAENTLVDQNVAVTEYAELDQSQAIFVKDGAIDTSVVIDAKIIKAQIALLEKRLAEE